MRPIAERLAAEGFTVELPRLPGHGTSIEDMLTTTWVDWSSSALAAYDDLASRCERVGVVGLSMGGGLTAFVAEQRPSVAACVFINPMVKPAAPELVDGVHQLLDAGLETFESGNGHDVKKEGVTETSYSAWPLPCLKSLFESLVDVHANLSRITAPSLVLTSREDHTVTTDNSDDLVSTVSGPIEHVWLEDSYHVATIDNDQELVETAVIAFLHRVFGE
jgi:carboxylesterase